MVTFDRLYDRIVTLCPGMNMQDFISQIVVLRDDGQGAYIAKWEHPTIARPTDEALAAVVLEEKAGS